MRDFFSTHKYRGYVVVRRGSEWFVYSPSGASLASGIRRRADAHMEVLMNIEHVAKTEAAAREARVLVARPLVKRAWFQRAVPATALPMVLAAYSHRPSILVEVIADRGEYVDLHCIEYSSPTIAVRR